MRLIMLSILLILKGLIPSYVYGLIFMSSRLAVVLAADGLNGWALLIICRPIPRWHLMRHSQGLLLRCLIGVVHVVLVLSLLHLLGLVVLIGSQKTLTISSSTFDSGKARCHHVAVLLVPLGCYSGIHALVHAMDLVLALCTAFLGNTAVGVALRAQWLPVACNILTMVTDRGILRVAMMASTFEIGIAVHLL